MGFLRLILTLVEENSQIANMVAGIVIFLAGMKTDLFKVDCAQKDFAPI